MKNIDHIKLSCTSSTSTIISVSSPGIGVNFNDSMITNHSKAVTVYVVVHCVGARVKLAQCVTIKPLSKATKMLVVNNYDNFY